MGISQIDGVTFMKVLPSGERCPSAWAIDESYGSWGRGCKRCESKGGDDDDDDDKDDGDGDNGNDDDVGSFCPGDSCWGRAQGEQVEDHNEMVESNSLNILHTIHMIW